MIDPLRPQPAPQGLIAEREAMMPRQLFHRQRRAKIAIVPRIERKDLPPEGGGLPPVRGLAPSPMRESWIPFGPPPVAEASNVARRES